MVPETVHPAHKGTQGAGSFRVPDQILNGSKAQPQESYSQQAEQNRFPRQEKGKEANA